MSGNRLLVVFVAGLLAASAITGVAPLAAGNTAQDASPESYVIEQGTYCEPIEPLQTSQTVESFYDYRNHVTHPDTDPEDRQYSSYGTTHLQEDDTSILMLHEGTDGMSLVMVHDQLHGNSSGGIVTFDIVGLPSESEWVVQDDKYEAETNMVEWDSGDGWAYASWIWRDARTDGGAIQGGLGDEFAVTIQPGFNEASDFHENESLHDPEWHEDGEIDSWEFLSGDADDPERFELALDEPVTIRTGACDEPSVTYDRTDDGFTASVTGVSGGDPITLRPSNDSNDNGSFDRIDVTGLEEDAAFSFENGQPAGTDSPHEVASLSNLTVTSDHDDVSATVAFSVSADTLEEIGYHPEDVALYATDGTEWTESNATVVDDSGGSYQFEADVDSLEALVIAPTQDAEPIDEESDALPSPGVAHVAVSIATLLALAAVTRRYRGDR
ncbi:hypothetical protein [Natrialba swarupiae]|uniref:PGF-pre-PGF domain-containing protein n=1 Tax=Natrialba swarupiae TaxID=2448032 RepID=A0A5D5ANM5_9EURY|nr:hypothetical protein [Natrialba swarupiae]TYT62495.1 hypothetical protein FYC77_08360 [Natrialba swarupiae]